jgi:hypothetical protein
MGQILGKSVTGESAASPTAAKYGPSLIATYEACDGTVAAVCVSDLELVANAGAALCMIPSYVAQESIKAKKLLEPSLMENYQEILNICARLFGDFQQDRIKLKKVDFAMSFEANQLMPDPACARRDFGLSIAGYGRGRMWICTQKAFNSVLL